MPSPLWLGRAFFEQLDEEKSERNPPGSLRVVPRSALESFFAPWRGAEGMGMATLWYFLLWGAFIFLMMRFGCGAHVMGHRHGHSPKSNGVPLPADPLWTPPGTALDPVCGMTVKPAGSKSTVHDGHVYYFCSQDCREKFEASPKTYTGGAASLPHNMEHGDEHQH